MSWAKTKAYLLALLRRPNGTPAPYRQDGFPVSPELRDASHGLTNAVTALQASVAIVQRETDNISQLFNSIQRRDKKK